tara:strand:- start:7932 stop:8276 length:345 start_codon:yes stop_codon:yes gene_type:complete
MIVDKGKKQLATKLSDTFRYIAVGDGGDDTSTSQETLDNEVYRIPSAITPSIVGNTLVYTATFTGANLSSNVISELGIFDASSGGNMLSRVNFNSIGPLASSESISFTFRLEVE